MQETPTIHALLSSIKAAADSADLLKTAGGAPEKTELQTKIAEMSSALAAAETAAADIRRVLEETLTDTGQVQRAGEVRDSLPHLTGEPGTKRDTASCPHCSEISKKAMHLHFAWPQSICPHCRSGYPPPQGPRQVPPGSDL